MCVCVCVLCVCVCVLTSASLTPSLRYLLMAFSTTDWNWECVRSRHTRRISGGPNLGCEGGGGEGCEGGGGREGGGKKSRRV